MKTITVKQVLAVSPERLFDVLADYANYKLIIDKTDSKLIREGKAERNGVGAVRELRTGRAWFHEEITEFERPRLISYRVIDSFIPIEHVGGSIVLAAVPEGTSAVWTTTLRIKLPLIGGLLTRIFNAQLERGFAATLKAAAHKAGAGPRRG